MLMMCTVFHCSLSKSVEVVYTIKFNMDQVTMNTGNTLYKH